MEKLEQKENINDVFEVELRDKIARKEKLAYVGKFSLEGMAVARKPRKFHLIGGPTGGKIISDTFGDKEREQGFAIEDSSLGVSKQYYIDRNGKKVSDEFDGVKDFSDGVS